MANMVHVSVLKGLKDTSFMITHHARVAFNEYTDNKVMRQVVNDESWLGLKGVTKMKAPIHLFKARLKQQAAQRAETTTTERRQQRRRQRLQTRRRQQTTTTTDMAGLTLETNISLRELELPALQDWLRQCGLAEMASLPWGMEVRLEVIKTIIADFKKTKLLRYNGKMIVITPDVIARTFKLKRHPPLSQPRVVTDEEMTDLFGQRAQTSEHCLSQMIDPVRRAGIRFVNELLNLKHVASYISKGVMGPVIDAEEGKEVDWAEFLCKSIEKELRVIDVTKGKTRMAAHLYMLLAIDPTAISVPIDDSIAVTPTTPGGSKQKKPTGKSILEASSNKKVTFKKRKRSEQSEGTADKTDRLFQDSRQGTPEN